MGWGDWGTAQHLGFLSSFLNAPNPNNTQLLIILFKKKLLIILNIILEKTKKNKNNTKLSMRV